MKEFLAIFLFLAFCEVTNSWPKGDNKNIVFTGHHDGGFCGIQWAYDKVNSPQTISFQLHCSTTGWVGLGITKSGSMKDADLMIGWVDKDNKPQLKSAHGLPTANGPPLYNNNQNHLKLHHGIQFDGFTEFAFTRDLDTCDPQNIVITGDTTTMLFAQGVTSPADNASFSMFDYHGATNRSIFKAHLLSKDQVDPPIPPDAITIEMRNPNVTVPASDTTYWCKVFQINRTEQLHGKPHHLIRSGLAFSTGKPHPFIHHLLLFRCSDSMLPPNWNINDELPEGQHCWGEHTPNSVVPHCQSAEIIVAWAVGSQDFNFPEDVGFRIGREEREVFMLEMHYNNPEMISGMSDDSGAKLVLTPTLRQHEGGCLMQGGDVWYGFAVPPKRENFVINGICHENCTNQALPEDGINVFAAILHTHTIGSKIKTRHIRGNKELEPLFQDDNYDFNFQTMVTRDLVKVMPKDKIMTECTYNSMTREKVTFGGLSTQEEMCYSFIFYYPRVDLADCISKQPSMEKQAELLGFSTTTSFNNNGWKWTKEWIAFVDAYNWTDQVKNEFQKLMNEEPRFYMCRKDNGEQYVDHVEELPPDIQEPYLPNNVACVATDIMTFPTTDTTGNNSARLVTYNMENMLLASFLSVILLFFKLHNV